MSLSSCLREVGGLRLLRAETLAGDGSVVWQASPGRLRARVSGQSIYAVQLDIALLPVNALAEQLRDRPLWVGQLLSGQLPEALVEQVSPRRLSSIQASCSCPDASEWCKHAMAVLLSVEQGGLPALLAWRGVSPSALLAALYPSTALSEDDFWSGRPLQRPVQEAVPTMQRMPALDIHGAPIQTVLEGSIARIQRAAAGMMDSDESKP